MATIDWPADLHPSSWDWGIQKAGVQFQSPYNGAIQSVELLAERWVVTVRLPPVKHGRASGAQRALWNYLAGGVNRVRLWDHGSGTQVAPGVPVGTMRGSPLLSVAVARGADAIVIKNAGGFATLMRGDMLGLSGHVLQVRSDVTANASGGMTVPLVNRIRHSIAVDTAVVWQRPTAPFVVPSLSARHAQVPAFLVPAEFDLVEVW